MNKNRLRALLILFGGIAISTFIVALKPKPQPHQPEIEPARPAKVVKVELRTSPIKIASQGKAEAKLDIELISQVAGQVVEVADSFAVGGRFNQGDKLLQIDSRDYQARLARAKGALATAKKELAIERGLAFQARREWKDLGNADANDLFLRKPQVSAAEAAVQAALADVEQAQLDLQRTTLTAPFAGRVVRIDVNLGQYLPVGKIVGRVLAPDIVEVRLPVTLRQAQLLGLNASFGSVDTDMPALKVMLRQTADHNSEQSWPATIVRVDPHVEETSRLIYLIAEWQQVSLESETLPLIPGSFVQAEISSANIENVAVLPRDALYQRDKVMLLNEEHHLNVVDVEVLQSNTEGLVVRGLSNGDLVLIKPPAFIELNAEYEPRIVSGGFES